MPLFITYASYSHSGVKGLVNKPEDRSGAVKALIEKAGGKLVALYNTTGSNDVVLVSELADGSDAVAMGMAVAATGALSKIETVRAWTPSEFKGIAEKAARVASAYAPPGERYRASCRHHGDRRGVDEAIFIPPRSAIACDQAVENSASRIHAQNREEKYAFVHHVCIVFPFRREGTCQ